MAHNFHDSIHNFPSGLPSNYGGLYETVDDPSFDSIISWSESNTSFIIWNVEKFEKLIFRKLYSRFLCCNFSRFLSQLDNYGFRRVKESKNLEFGHKKYFVRGKPELLKDLQRKNVRRRIRNEYKAFKAQKKAEESLQNLQI